MQLIRQPKYYRVTNGKIHLRNHIHGTAERPRLNVILTSAPNIYAQIIDDEKGVTLTAASSVDNWFKYFPAAINEAAKLVGAVIAKRALKKGITEVVLDMDGYTWRGRAAALLLEAAREAGLKFYSEGGQEYCLVMKSATIGS